MQFDQSPGPASATLGIVTFVLGISMLPIYGFCFALLSGAGALAYRLYCVAMRYVFAAVSWNIAARSLAE